MLSPTGRLSPSSVQAVQTTTGGVPSTIANLPAGTLVTGTMIGRDAAGQALLRTDAGTLALATRLDLPRGSIVTLRVQGGPTFTATIISVDGRPPVAMRPAPLPAAPAPPAAAGAPPTAPQAPGLAANSVVTAVVVATNPDAGVALRQFLRPGDASGLAIIAPGSRMTFQVVSTDVAAPAASPAPAAGGPAQAGAATSPASAAQGPTPASAVPALASAARMPEVAPVQPIAPVTKTLHGTPQANTPAASGATGVPSQPQGVSPRSQGAPSQLQGAPPQQPQGASQQSGGASQRPQQSVLQQPQGATPRPRGASGSGSPVPAASGRPAGGAAAAAAAPSPGAVPQPAGVSTPPSGQRPVAAPGQRSGPPPNTAPGQRDGAPPNAAPGQRSGASPNATPRAAPGGLSAPPGPQAAAADAAAPRVASGAQAAPATPLIAAVVGADSAGRPVLNLPFGTVRLETPAPLSAGTTLILNLLKVEPEAPPPAAAPTTRAEALLAFARDWPALREFVEAVRTIDPGLGAQVALHAAARPGPTLTSAVLFFLAVLRGGDVSSWLGRDAVRLLVANNRGDLVRRVARDLGQVARLAEPPAPGEWQPLMVPLYDGEMLRQLRLFVRGHRRPDDDADDDGGTRFVVDVELSRLGDLQLDGFLHEKRFDLILRSHAPMPTGARRDIAAIFDDGLAVSGLAGTLNFQVTATFPVAPLEDIVAGDHSGVLV